MRADKPKVFIGSSSEASRIADAVNLNLDQSLICSPTTWKTDTFRLSSHTIDDLVLKSSNSDFAVFIFSADDVITIRDTTTAAVRDNLVFELGLFIGAIGKSRCFIVQPRGTELRLPSDLLGMTTAQYDSDRVPSETSAALAAACTQIKTEIETLGIFRRETLTAVANRDAKGPVVVPNPREYEITRVDFDLLGECTATEVEYPDGLSFQYLNRKLAYPDNAVRLSALKLTRLGYLDKTVRSDDHDDGEYYVYHITDEGLTAFLESGADPFSGALDNIPF